jgi:hypothetical protein
VRRRAGSCPGTGPRRSAPLSDRRAPSRYQALLSAAFTLTSLRDEVHGLAERVQESEVASWMARIETLESQAIRLLEAVEGPRSIGH